MRLSDIMSAMGLAIYPTIALFVFLAVFIGVLIRIGRRGNSDALTRAGRLPLADDAPLRGVGDRAHYTEIHR